LADVEQLAKEGFMLVPIKTIVQQVAKGCPSERWQLGRYGLVPASSCTLDIMLNQTDPNRWMYLVGVEIFLTEGTPTAGIFTIEFWKWEFR
jgi:hypothetical protein